MKALTILAVLAFGGCATLGTLHPQEQATCDEFCRQMGFDGCRLISVEKDQLGTRVAAECFSRGRP